MQETQLQSLGRGDPLEEGMAIHSGILAWRTSWTEKLRSTVDGLQSMGSHSCRGEVPGIFFVCPVSFFLLLLP